MIAVLERSIAAPGSLAEASLGGGFGLEGSLGNLSALKSRPSLLDETHFNASNAVASAHLTEVCRGDGYFVSTGHQPVLFLGPLYVIYKVLTAIALAETLAASTGKAVLPLFWVASDDHDWAEVGTTSFLGSGHTVETVSVSAPAGRERFPVGSHPVGEDTLKALDHFLGQLPATEFSSHYTDLLRTSYVEGVSLGQAFGRLIQGVLGDRPFVWVDSASAGVKTTATPFYEKLWERYEVVLEASEEGAARVEEEGFAAPIELLEGGLPMFYETEGGRERVRWPTTTSFSFDSERLSPNVASRPVLESWLLPIAATVLGPGEASYWAQLPPLFRAMDTPLPRICPRSAWTLLEPRTRRWLGKAGALVEDIEAGPEQVIERLVREGRPTRVDAALGVLGSALEEGLEGVDLAVREELPGLTGSVGRARREISRAMRDVMRQVDRDTRRNLDGRVTQLKRAHTHLFPKRRPQERVMNPFPYLCRYGEGFMDHLTEVTTGRVQAWL